MTTLAVAGNRTAGRHTRTGMDVESIKRTFADHLACTMAKVPGYSTAHDRFVALSMMIRDRLIQRWISTRCAYYNRPDAKRIYYLSLEFLVGRTLGNCLVNLQMYDECYQALMELGYDLEEIREVEEDAGLGNGGLGRLAACFLDSMATLSLPGYGYGIRYEYGMFKQRCRNGYQVEEPDNWLRLGNPWEIARPEHTFTVQFHGRVESHQDERGQTRFRWVDTHDILAMPYDTPVPGYNTNTVNTLRLFSAKSTQEFELDYFNHGDYIRACEDKSLTENITRVLYPSDNVFEGRELRLKQEYLLVSASLQDILDRFRKQHDDWHVLPDHAAIQLNDTHPALAIPELMRLLMDREGLGWDEAWDITVRSLAYTNHTVMPEALEKWPVSLLGRLLPRHLQIIHEINRRLLEQVAAGYPGDEDRLQRMSLIEDGDEPRVRMASLAVVGSHSVNGVSALHTQIIRAKLFYDFQEFFPNRLSNKTNGVTPRRWLKKCNPVLSYLISDAIGGGWVTELDQLRQLMPFADDAEFRTRWHEAKRMNKELLAAYVLKHQGVRIDPDTMFDCQVKRIHEYKRQLLNVLHVITLYNRIKAYPQVELAPRTVLIGGKAAPGYRLAKLIIKLVNAVASVVNNDPTVGGRLKLFFLENYGVSLAEKIFPAAELSQQISTAGTEASGTSNMKFALNGALTIGTLDGANIEIMEEAGQGNIFIFGLTAEEVADRLAGGHNPWEIYHGNAELKLAIDQIADNVFSPHEPDVFQPIIDALLTGGDRFLVLADYEAYVRCQECVSAVYHDQQDWCRKSIYNTANMGKFSSDRTVQEYATHIWRAQPIPVTLLDDQQ